MRYAENGMKRIDTANGPGVRVSLFVQGCRKHCEGCFNSETWDFCGGLPFGEAEQECLLGWLAPDYISGLTLLGGDPTEPENVPAVLALVKEAKRRFPEKSVWIFSGDTLPALTARFAGEPALKELLTECDVLVDGPFVAALKNLGLMFRGSSNQRILDLKKTAAAGWKPVASDIRDAVPPAPLQTELSLVRLSGVPDGKTFTETR